VAHPRGRRRLVTLSILLLAALTLLAIGGPLRSVASKGARAVVSPFVAVVHGVTKPIGNAMAGVFNYGDVVAQNHVLSQEITQLHQQQVENEYQQHQLRDLLALERLPYLNSLPTVTAQLTAQNLSNFAATIEIDKGTAAGVLVGMPVVGGGGLVGLVTSATQGGATVTLVTDASSSVGVTFGHGNAGVVHGQGPGRELAVNFVAPGTPIHPLEHLFTNGLQGGLYPGGIPVGTVVGSRSNRGATQQSIAAVPIANLSDLAYVDVVLWEPGS
jgi:rod shape-determining protein MreC